MWLQNLAIAALSTEDLACYELIIGTTNGDKWYDFIRNRSIPIMHPFPGQMNWLMTYLMTDFTLSAQVNTEG